MINQIKQHTEWVTLNIVNAIYLVKEWVLLQIGATSLAQESAVDIGIKWAIGISILVFNIVRIVKYILEIKDRKK